MKTIAASAALLMLQTSPAPAITPEETAFAPISFALTCAKNTQKKITLHRNKNATSDVSSTECIDGGRMTSGMIPAEVVLSYLPSVDHYEIEIKLPSDGAKNLEAITQNINFRKLFIISNHRIITSGILSTPHRGAIFQLSAPDRRSAEKIIDLISKTSSELNKE